ncbi:MAG TPA: RDD family protein [Streptosporangiaceae bacterium]|jgi:uncharacterized RDD family membrane protein YckC
MSMPQDGGSGQSWEAGPQPGVSGQQWQGGTPAQPSAAAQPGVPGPGGYPGGPQGQQYGSPPPGGVPGQHGAAPHGAPASPVSEIDTRVTGRRIVQYIIDAILTGIVFSLISWALDRGTGGVHVILWVVLVLVNIAWYFLYWVARPYISNGQTLGMQLLGIRVISKDGGPASVMQLFIRSVLLVLFTPLSLLIGIITMMFSRYRQRVGDHLAGTLVVRSSVQPIPAQREFAGAGQAGTR